MPPQDASFEATVWTDARSIDAIETILGRMRRRVRPIGIGGPRLGEVRTVAERCRCAAGDDLRKLLVDHPAAFLLVTTADGVRPEDIVTAIEQGTVVLTTEPIAGELHELARLKPKPRRPKRSGAGGSNGGDDGGTAGESARAVITADSPALALRGSAVPSIDTGGDRLRTPRFQAAPGWVSATDPVEAVGAVQLIHHTAFGRADDLSLFARLCDAWDVVLDFSPLPLEIDAALSGPLNEPPADLRALTGGMSAMARLPEHAVATITVSDQHATAFRRLYVLGDKAQLSIGDGDYRVFDAEGHVVDQKRPGRRASFVDLVVHQWRDLLRHRSHHRPAHEQTLSRDAQVLACCHAALLSARTGEPESPGRMMQMHYRP